MGVSPKSRLFYSILNQKHQLSHVCHWVERKGWPVKPPPLAFRSTICTQGLTWLFGVKSLVNSRWFGIRSIKINDGPGSRVALPEWLTTSVSWVSSLVARRSPSLRLGVWTLRVKERCDDRSSAWTSMTSKKHRLLKGFRASGLLEEA